MITTGKKVWILQNPEDESDTQISLEEPYDDYDYMEPEGYDPECDSLIRVEYKEFILVEVK